MMDGVFVVARDHRAFLSSSIVVTFGCYAGGSTSRCWVDVLVVLFFTSAGLEVFVDFLLRFPTLVWVFDACVLACLFVCNLLYRVELRPWLCADTARTLIAEKYAAF